MSITSRINEMSSHIEEAYDELQGLGADLTNVDKNIENISMVLDDIYDSLPSVSGEGTSLTLNNTKASKIKSTLKGNTSQNGTPTPDTNIPVNVVSGDNEINVCGKNLYNANDTTYYSACTYVSGANTNQYKVKATGTDVIINLQISSGTSYSSVAGTLIPCKYGETIYYNTGNSNFGKNLVTQYNSNKVSLGFSTLNIGDSSGSYTPTNSDCEYISIRIGYGSATSGTEYTLAPIISKSSNLTYEPYIINTYNVDLPVDNLAKVDYNYNQTTNGVTCKVNSNGSISLSGTATANTAFVLSTDLHYQKGTYTISCEGLPTSSDKIRIRFRNANGSYSDGTISVELLYNRTSYSFTNRDVNNFEILVLSGVTVDDTLKVQLEKGSKQNAFTPYGTTPIELCSSSDGTKRDYFLHDRTLDKWYWHREIGKVVLNGSESWQVHGAIASWFYVDNLFYGITANAKKDFILSDYFVQQSYNYVTTLTNGECSYASPDGGTTYRLVIKDTDYTTVADFENWLSTHNVTLNYQLATPTNTEITYQPLIDQLNELEKAMSKDGQTNISQVNNDLPFIISASALKKRRE